jgi:hypothetical protein
VHPQGVGTGQEWRKEKPLSTEARKEGQTPKAWWRSPRLLLAAIAILAVVVVARLGLYTYWTLTDGNEAALSARMIVFWVLAAIALGMLSRFAWQIWTGKHWPR